MNDIAARYRALVAAGELSPDAAQARAVGELQRIATALEKRPATGLWTRLARSSRAHVRGLYIWGGVGRGKSMLMDLLFETVAISAKRRAHFHAFMLEVDERLRIERVREAGDPIEPVARALANEARLLCFDEMVVTNTADAALMGRLFTSLIEGGVTLVTTSNRPPEDLYKDGLNRTLFLPFIRLVEDRLTVLPLDGPVDYRRRRLGDAATWHVPNGPEATAALSQAFFQMTDYPVEDRANVPSCDLAVGGGRTLHVPKALKGVAVFSFRRLCGEPRGSADYLAIAQRFHTVFLVGIPVMGPEDRAEAARFVKLIDVLYECRVKLLASADASPDALYQAGDGVFEFERTVSRLIEMESEGYLNLPHGCHGSKGLPHPV